MPWLCSGPNERGATSAQQAGPVDGSEPHPGRPDHEHWRHVCAYSLVAKISHAVTTSRSGDRGSCWAHKIGKQWILSCMTTPSLNPSSVACRFNIWTNDVYKSTVHRVINNSANFRTSVPFFLEPDFDALIKPLPINVQDASVCKRSHTKLGTCCREEVICGKAD